MPVTDRIKYILLDDLPDMEDDILNQAIGRISVGNASESLLKTQEHSMIAQDEIICRLAEGKLQGIEEGRAKGLAEAKRAAIVKALNRGKLTTRSNP